MLLTVFFYHVECEDFTPSAACTDCGFNKEQKYISSNPPTNMSLIRPALKDRDPNPDVIRLSNEFVHCGVYLEAKSYDKHRKTNSKII